MWQGKNTGKKYKLLWMFLKEQFTEVKYENDSFH